MKRKTKKSLRNLATSIDKIRGIASSDADSAGLSALRDDIDGLRNKVGEMFGWSDAVLVAQQKQLDSFQIRITTIEARIDALVGVVGSLSVPGTGPQPQSENDNVSG